MSLNESPTHLNCMPNPRALSWILSLSLIILPHRSSLPNPRPTIQTQNSIPRDTITRIGIAFSTIHDSMVELKREKQRVEKSRIEVILGPICTALCNFDNFCEYIWIYNNAHLDFDHTHLGLIFNSSSSSCFIFLIIKNLVYVITDPTSRVWSYRAPDLILREGSYWWWRLTFRLGKGFVGDQILVRVCKVI